MNARQLCARATISAVAAMTLSGCGGGSPSPAHEVPRLAAVLSRVDQALTDQRYAAARHQLDALLDKVARALADGDLTEEQADRVTAAAARLLLAIPEPLEVAASPVLVPMPAPTSTSEPRHRSGSADGKGDGHDGPGKGGGGKGKGRGKNH